MNFDYFICTSNQSFRSLDQPFSYLVRKHDEMNKLTDFALKHGSDNGIQNV